MTPMSVLPDTLAADMPTRPALQNSADGAGGDQAKKFLELLGQLMGHQGPGRPAGPRQQDAGGAEDAGHPSPAWKFRMGDGLVLRGGADVAGAQAATSQPTAAAIGAELPAMAEGSQGEGAGVMPESPAGMQSGETGKEAGTDDAQATPPDQLAPAPMQQLPARADALLPDRPPAVSEIPTRTGSVPAAAQVAPETKARRGGQSTEIAAASAAKAGTADPAPVMPVGDGPEMSAPRVSVDQDGDAKRQDGPLSVAGETRVAVLRSETHLPPSGHTLPMHQIAERIEVELASVETGDIATDSTSLVRASVKPESVVKVLQIQLQPAELGTVTVRMSLRRDVLEVQLHVSQQDTAHLLRHDREALSKVLQSAGYVLDGLAVHVVEPDRTASTTQLGTQGNHAATQSSVHSQADWSQPDGRHSDMQREAQREGRRASVQSEPAPGSGNTAPTSNGGIYL